MRLPRKWVLSLGLLAAAPHVTQAGPFDSLKRSPENKPAEAASAQPSNQDVANEIAKSLRQTRLVGRNIEIEYKAGVAILKGEVADAEQRARAEQAAASVTGVDSVENQLTLPAGRPRTLPSKSGVQQAALQGEGRGPVQPVNYEGRSNQEVAQQIAESMSGAGLSGYDIEIRYKNGIASLIGGVEDQEQAARAQQAAMSVPGVEQVLNRLTVNGELAQVPANYGARPQAYAPQMGYPQGGAYPPGAGQPGVRPAAHMQPGAGPAPVMAPPNYGHAAPASHQIYNQPNMPEHAWPAYAQYDNYAGVTYPNMYDASAWPYIGPFYPYPQVPLGWRSAQLTWDDGYWNLKFNSRTDRWWWFMNPENWH